MEVSGGPNGIGGTEVTWTASKYCQTYLAFENPAKRLSSTLSFNVSGPKLAVVGLSGTPDVYEQPRPMLDFNIRKGFAGRWSVKLAATNLLDSEFRLSQKFKDIEYVYQSYRIGRTVSLSFTYLIE